MHERDRARERERGREQISEGRRDIARERGGARRREGLPFIVDLDVVSVQVCHHAPASMCKCVCE